MANADAPAGFRPVKNLSGAPYTGATIKCSILVGDGTATFVGDPVKLAGSASAEGYPSVIRGAAADTAFFGVIQSFDPDPDALGTIYRTASTLRNCNVIPANDALFVIQMDGAFAITDVGETVDVSAGTGSTVTGLSAMELVSTNIGTGLNCLILGIDQRPDNEIDTNCDVVVRINETPMISGGDIGV